MAQSKSERHHQGLHSDSATRDPRPPRPRRLRFQSDGAPHHADHGFRKANSIVVEFLRFVHEDDTRMLYITLCANLAVV